MLPLVHLFLDWAEQVNFIHMNAKKMAGIPKSASHPSKFVVVCYQSMTALTQIAQLVTSTPEVVVAEPCCCYKLVEASSHRLELSGQEAGRDFLLSI